MPHVAESWQTSCSKLSETISTSDHSDAGGCMQAALPNIAPLGGFFPLVCCLNFAADDMSMYASIELRHL